MLLSPHEDFEENIAKKAYAFHDEIAALNGKISVNESADEVCRSYVEDIWSCAVAREFQQTKESRLEILRKRQQWSGINPEKASIASDLSYTSDIEKEWLEGFQHVAAAMSDSYSTELQPLEEEKHIPFVHMWLPIKKYAKKLLKERINIDNTDVSVEVIDKIVSGLVITLSNNSIIFFWQLFQDERSPTDFLLAQLNCVGKSQDELSKVVYNNFISDQLKDGMKHLFVDYPMFSRSVGIIFTYWIKNSVRMIERFDIDMSEICTTFGIHVPWRGQLWRT